MPAGEKRDALGVGLGAQVVLEPDHASAQLSTVYLPIDTMITTAIDQAIRLANDEDVEPIPPFTGTLVLRDSVMPGPYFK